MSLPENRRVRASNAENGAESSSPAPPLVVLSHLLEALRQHRLRIGSAWVPRSLVELETEIVVALSGACDAGPSRLDVPSHTGRVLVDVDPAAHMLSVSPRTVRSLRAAGRLPAVKVGECVRFAVADLDNFVTEQRETL